MALDENALVTWEKLKSLFGISTDDSQPHYEDLINSASAVANRYTGRRLAARDYTVVLDGCGCKSLLLPEYPVQSVTSLFIDTTRTFSTEAEITDYLLYAEHGEIYYEGLFPDVRQSVKVIYNAGFNPIPEDLQAAVAEIVAWMERRLYEKGVGIGIRQIQGPAGGSTEYEMTIPLAAQRKLDLYVRREYG
jgi:hypothetical protein